MSETPIGTDHVELTDAEREALWQSAEVSIINCDYDSNLVAAVESIVAARVQAVTAERDRLQRDIDTLTHDNATVGVLNYIAEKQKSERESTTYIHKLQAELAAANAKISKWAEDYKKLAHDCGGTEMDRQALAARCAELEKQREALSFELQALRATPWHQRMEKAEATLDRVTALADEWNRDKPPRTASVFGRALRSAISGDGA